MSTSVLMMTCPGSAAADFVLVVAVDDDPARTGPQLCSAVKSVWLSPYPETPPKPPYPSRTMPTPLVSRFGGGGQLADDLQGQRG